MTATVRLERELRRILEDVPELSEFFGFPSRRTVLGQSAEGSVLASVQKGVEITFPVGAGERGQGTGPLGAGETNRGERWSKMRRGDHQGRID